MKEKNTNKLEIVYVAIDKIKPYKNNPRNNKKAIDKVAKSIQEYGFKVPCVLDSNFVLITGHTRYEAAKKIGMKKVPCIIADDLSKDKVREFRIADNKVAEYSEWDFDKLEQELANVDLDEFNFDFGVEMSEDIDWSKVEDLSEESYRPPEVNNLRCPHCGHIDSKAHFVKVNIPVLRKEVKKFKIRYAKSKDIDAIKAIADSNSKSIGLVLRPALEEAAENKKLIVAVDENGTVLGFCNYNIRKKDDVLVIYEICVDTMYRKNGIAECMIKKLPKPIVAKCPVDNESNKFYKRVGFELIRVDEGKKRKLNVWELDK